MARAAAWNRASSAASRSSNCASPASKRSWNEVRPWTAFEHAGSAGRAAQRRNLLHAERGPHHHRVVARALQQGPPAQRAWLPATGARRNHPKLAVRLRSATPTAQLGLSGRFGLTLLLDHQVQAVHYANHDRRPTRREPGSAFRHRCRCRLRRACPCASCAGSAAGTCCRRNSRPGSRGTAGTRSC